MFKRLYITMTLYFLCVIVTTLVAVTIVFFFTVGRPLAREVHTMLRSHTLYLAGLVQDAEASDSDGQDLVTAFDRFRECYGFDIALFDHDRRPIAVTSESVFPLAPPTQAMVETMTREGLFVQSSHFGRPLIYMLPVDLGTGTPSYLYITRHFAPHRTPVLFLGGLGVIGLLLTVAVYPLSRGITGPLTRLTRDLEKIAAARFEEIPESRRKDEIGQLIRGYRAMSQSLHHMIVSKKQLLADISHELCSPLARIRVSTELIREKSSDPTTGRYLINIENDIESLDHLVDSLAVFSRMNLPGFSLTCALVTPRDLLGPIVEIYLPSSDSRNIQLTLAISGAYHAVLGDFERLKQVFSNLLDNALRYTDPGETIVLGAEDQGPDLCFYVEDPGPGVPESDREKIFDPLYRVDFSRNRTLGGAGLGLSIARRIVELHGGTLSYSRANHRTRFSFCLKKAH